MKRTLIPVLLIFILIFTTYCNEPDKSESFSFVFMTDVHLKPENNAPEGFKKAIEKINLLNPDFVISGGDQIDDALEQSYERADLLFNMYSDHVKTLKMPIYNVLGNHDIFGIYKKSGIDPSHPLYGKKMFEKILNKKHYSFDHKGWHFIILDGIGFTPERRYYGYMDSLQLVWLKNDLAHVDKKTPIVISTHIPLFSIYGQMKNGPTFAMGQGSVVTNALDVIKSLENHNLRLVLQGHLHIVEEIRYGGTTYITG
ncbi:MAG: metallophosphoesterase, partial [Candidatus Aminicenantes bacterium]|nr:metallophosphoesterase [Candidatus Aminicenantes bacterium]